MKTYKKVMSFGCSFTKGVGLNNQIHYNYLNGIIDTRHNNIKQEYIDYMNENCYPAQLSKLLDCEFENYSIPRSSNDFILKKLFENTCNIKDGTNILVTVQTTLLSRIMLYLNKSKEFVTINNSEGLSKILEKYYKLYIREFYNKEVEFDKLMQNIDVYTFYLQGKNFDVVWMLYETAYIPKESKIMICFDNTDLSQFIANNKLRLSDLLNYPTYDAHFSEEGHSVIANKILEHVRKYYD